IQGFGNPFADFYTATFSTPASLTSGTTYCYVLRLVTARSAGNYAVVRSNSSTYSSGARYLSTNSGGTWTAQTQDHTFKTYMTGTLVYATSGNLVSSVKDSNPPVGPTPNWSSLSWTATTPANTALKFQLATSSSASGPFTFLGPDGTAATFFTTSPASPSSA